MTKDLPLKIELVPRAIWYSNMRTNMPRSAWDKIRKEVYAQYNHRCGICQTSASRMNCHEIWSYDDEKHIQKLEGFISLCDMCHHCKHMGLAGVLAERGQLNLEDVVAHFMQVNQCTRKEYQKHSDQAWDQWEERNKSKEWTTEFGAYAHLVTLPKTKPNDGSAYDR